MTELIYKIITTILDILLKNKLESKDKEQSPCKALFFTYLSVCAIIEEAEKILVKIDRKLDPHTKYEGGELKKSLLEIYRQTKAFVETTHHLDRLVSIYDPETGRLFRFMYVCDLNLFSSLDNILENVGTYFRKTGRIADCDPFEQAPIDGRLVRFLGWGMDKELSEIREQEGFEVISINNLEYLQKLKEVSEDRIDRLKASSEKLAEFIRVHCSFTDFVELKKGDLDLWRSSREPSKF